MRSDARECALKIVYASMINDENLDELRDNLFKESEFSKSDMDFTNELLDCYFQHKEEIESIISDIAFGYKIERLYLTDRSILALTIAQMKYFNTIPLIVSISEGMELVRKYCGEDSPNFVNGILAEYKKRLENGNT